MITQEQLKSKLRYNKKTGVFYWVDGVPATLIGKQAGTADLTGRIRITLNGKKYPAHHLAWLWVHGVMPTKSIDHKNRSPSNNRISNLREATPAQQNQNLGMSKRNTSGYIGVSRVGNKWRARISSGGVVYYLGTYDTPEEAHKAYKKAKAELHTFNPRVKA
jgi:hypothetical protein